jgi:hypothetical protein
MTTEIVIQDETVVEYIETTETEIVVTKEPEIETVYYGNQIIQLVAGQSKIMEFLADDWTLIGGQYILTLQHMLESINAYIARAINNSGNDVDFQKVENPTANTIKIYMPAISDARFAGKVIIQKV